MQNVIERAVILCGGGQRAGDPNTSGFSLGTDLAAPRPPARRRRRGEATLSLDELEKRHILAVLEHCQGNRTQAAKKLGISVRTMRNKLNEYGVSDKDDAGEGES